jgi:hypothetical protein
MTNQLHLNLMQAHTAEIARNAEAGRHAAALRSSRVAKTSRPSRVRLGWLRALPVLRQG